MLRFCVEGTSVAVNMFSINHDESIEWETGVGVKGNKKSWKLMFDDSGKVVKQQKWRGMWAEETICGDNARVNTIKRFIMRKFSLAPRQSSAINPTTLTSWRKGKKSRSRADF